MNSKLGLAALVAVALISSSSISLAPAIAQAPAPDFSKRLERTPPPTDTIIVKYKTADKLRRLDVEATARASSQVGLAVAPMHRLSTDAMDALSAQAGITLAFEREMSGDAFVLKLPEPLPYEDTARIAKQLEQLGEVEYASPSGRRSIALVPNDPRYAEQWHYTAPVPNSFGANLPAAWDVTTGSASIVIAVLDTGIRFDHPDLAGRTVAGYDFVSDVPTANDGDGRDADASDPGDYGNCPGIGNVSSSWHGTHVAGTIGAASNNSVGVAGINWVSKILPIRVLGRCGGDDVDIVDGMRWAAGLSVPGAPSNPNPARVLNLSLGGVGPCTSPFQSAINEIVARNAVVVVAAGNSSGSAAAEAPGNCPNVITVAATDRNGNRASYSNFGSLVEISAPGGSGGTGSVNAVLSTLNSGTTTPASSSYQFYNGTSMAAPHVAGIASLVLSVNPSLSPFQVANLLQATVTPFPAGSTCNTTNCGAGIVNAFAAVQAAPVITGEPTTPRAHIPIVINQPTLTGTGALVNGDFEQGWKAGWTTLTQFPCNDQYAPATCDPVIYQNDEFFLDGASPHSGNWAAWLGGFNNANVFLRQTVKVPSNTSYLAFWQMVASNDFCGDAFDVANVLVNGVSVRKIFVCSSTHNFPGWAKQVVDLSAFKNQTVSLEFTLKTDSSIRSSWLLDDIAFQATP